MAARIIVDWGTSSFRAYRFGTDGAISDQHQAAAGILTVKDGAFEDALLREIGPWLEGAGELLFSGMITSRNGWVETPYIEAPATLAALADGAVTRKDAAGRALRFLPGVCARSPLPDVMRGEEIQVFGAIAPEEDVLVILPGTHSKWVDVRAGVITGFRTFMTGEMFAVLRQHSIVGRLIPGEGGAFDEAAFLAGVSQAAGAGSAGLLNDAFTTRSGVLLDAFPAVEIADRLSGIVIGHEIRAGLALLKGTSPKIRLVGDDKLVRLYRQAFARFGQEADIAPPLATVEGFRRLALLG